MSSCQPITANTTLMEFIDYLDEFMWGTTKNTDCRLRVNWTGTECVITNASILSGQKWVLPTELLMSCYEHRLDGDLHTALNFIIKSAVAELGPKFGPNEDEEEPQPTHHNIDIKQIVEDIGIPYDYNAWLGTVCGYVLSKYEYNSVQTVKCPPDEHLDTIDENYGILCQYRDKMNLGLGVDAHTLRAIYKDCGSSQVDWQLKIDQTLHYRLLSIIESHYVTNSGVVS